MGADWPEIAGGCAEQVRRDSGSIFNAEIAEEHRARRETFFAVQGLD
jgi:hypothetical protein